jgi:DNA processing protein
VSGAARWTLALSEPGYPDALEALGRRAPERLNGLGDRALLEGLEPRSTVTIVGARRASGYGLEIAEELGRELAAAGLVVVSGMARGIDAAAHRGALAAGRSVAVLGGGADVVYPARERALHRRLVSEGAVVSERAFGERPETWSFPARNRIMGALGGMTVVVEAAERSGSSITADEAIRCGRSVGAVPGNVTSWLSAGPNRLLADGARVVRGPSDILEELLGVGATAAVAPGPALEAELRLALDTVERGAESCDAVAVAAGLEAHAAAVALARLELLGYVRAGIAGGYVRTALVAPSPAEEGG